MSWKIALIGAAILAVLGAISGALCARPKPEKHKQERIEAQVAASRAQDQLEIQEIEIEIKAGTKEKVREIEEEVQNVGDSDLVDAINGALGH